MLDNNALAQLKGLREELEALNEYTEAIIKGTKHRYGFAVVGDGREIFVPPNEMLKVLPGDKVSVCIRPTAPNPAKANNTNRSVAEVEKVLEPGVERFVGTILQKGNALFVVPDLPNFTRWLYLPPHTRNGVKSGDFAECALLKHPIKDGKPTAKILRRLGRQSTPGIENLYCAVRAELPTNWTDKQTQSLVSEALKKTPLEDRDRLDLTHLHFVSIDAARTLDIDDVLHAEVTHKGWQLTVAIADPLAYFHNVEGLPETLARRGASIYFHGDIIPMLPELISKDYLALSEGKHRPALVCQMQIMDSGEIGSFQFHKAVVCSKAKLSYSAVERYITGTSDELMTYSNPLEALVQAYRKLREYRQNSELVMENRREYRWVLGEDKQIFQIECHEKLASQYLVEECMIAANKAAASYLQDTGAPGPFVVHRGFRADRLDEARIFLARNREHLKDEDLESISGYRTVIADLTNCEHPLPLRSMINRLLTRTQFDDKARPHMGLAVKAYTNFTSPLRKAFDFFVHLQLHACLSGEVMKNYPAESLVEITKALERIRAANNAADRRLSANFLSRQAADGTRVYGGSICHITSSGFYVRLDDNGLEGLVDLRRDNEKFSFDKWTMSLTSPTRQFQLGQSVVIEFINAPAERDFLALFKITDTCALKPDIETCVS